MNFKLIVNGQEVEIETTPEMTLGEAAQIGIDKEGFKTPLEGWSVRTPTGLWLEKYQSIEYFIPPLFVSLNAGIGA